MVFWLWTSPLSGLQYFELRAIVIPGSFEFWTFEYGTFEDGTFEYGIFNYGTFEHGTFEEGNFRIRNFRTRNFRITEFSNMEFSNSGTFEYGIFVDGTFEYGTFEFGTLECVRLMYCTCTKNDYWRPEPYRLRLLASFSYAVSLIRCNWRLKKFPVIRSSCSTISAMDGVQWAVRHLLLYVFTYCTYIFALCWRQSFWA